MQDQSINTLMATIMLFGALISTYVMIYIEVDNFIKKQSDRKSVSLTIVAPAFWAAFYYFNHLIK